MSVQVSPVLTHAVEGYKPTTIKELLDFYRMFEAFERSHNNLKAFYAEYGSTKDFLSRYVAQPYDKEA